MSDSDASLLLEFKVESQEHLNVVEPALLEMEHAPDARRTELIHEVFRAVHSVKGTAGFFGLDRIQGLAHAMETLLMPVRDGVLPFAPPMVDVLLRGLDKLAALLDALPEALELDVEPEISACMEQLGRDGTGAGASNAPVDTPTSPAAQGRNRDFVLTATREQWKDARRFGQRLLRIRLTADQLADDPWSSAFRERLTTCADLVQEAAHEDGGSELLVKALAEPADLAQEVGLDPDAVFPVAKPASRPKKPPATAPSASDPKGAPTEATAPSESASAVQPTSGSAPATESVRVNVRLLDRLMNLAGELVLSRNQLLRCVAKTADSTTNAVLQDLDQITSELQGNIVNTRMQAMGLVFNKFTRIVRDLSRSLSKEVDLSIEGSDVELDKSIVELLSDPLTHLIRNALDHGIETPDLREAAGKPRQGQITLRAFHEGGQVHIEIEDDGAGIDPAKTRQVAVERGVLTREEANALSDNKARMLIFAAGFTTKKKVTDVSGRGVGMDVVKTNIARLGGKIDLESEPGQGSKLTIRLPLTLAIIPSLIVSADGERFAIPQVNLVELIRVRAEDHERRLAHVNDAEVVRLRGHLLPIVRLAEVLGGSPEPNREAGPPRGGEGEEAGSLQIVVLQVGEAHFGLVVDAILDSEEVVVKPLSNLFDECGIYAGATIMGDGCVAMILDAAGLATVAELRLEESKLVARAAHAEQQGMAHGAERRQLVLFTNAPGEHFAIDLHRVLRLERISRADLQLVGGQECLDYRGRSLPVVRLEDRLPVGPTPSESSELFVLIPRGEEAGSGILASRIVDTVDAVVQLEEVEESAPGLLGRAIVDGHLTLLLEPAGVCAPREVAA
ncbi:MAG: chemotaxis protein CheA [Myxococcota bacterium]